MQDKNMKKNNMKILCKTCYWQYKDRDVEICSIIENKHGGSINADKTECDLYLKKGTEPKQPCVMCGDNTYGQHCTGDITGWYCLDCWIKKEAERDKKEKQKKLAKKQKAIEKILKQNLAIEKAVTKLIKLIED